MLFVFVAPFLCLLRHLFLFQNPTVLYILLGFGFGRLASSPNASPPSSFRYSPDASPPSLFRPATSFHGQLQPQDCHQAGPSPWLVARHGCVGGVVISCRNWCLQFVISAELRSKTFKMQYGFTIAIHRPLRTVSTLMPHSTVV